MRIKACMAIPSDFYYRSERTIARGCIKFVPKHIREESAIYEPNLLNGFWSSEKHYGFLNTFIAGKEFGPKSNEFAMVTKMKIRKKQTIR